MNLTWKKVVAIAGGITITIAAADVIVEKANSVQMDIEAETWRKGHILTESERFKADRIDRVERESNRIEYDLLDESLKIKEIDFLKRQLIKNDKKIECIQRDEC